MKGFLNIDKAAGLTSHDVVARVRRLAGRGVKVGHAGTLDPAATGVLPLALGQATRLIAYLADARKG
jgi:tRNA pseudouridine55 synthase